MKGQFLVIGVLEIGIEDSIIANNNDYKINRKLKMHLIKC